MRKLIKLFLKHKCLILALAIGMLMLLLGPITYTYLSTRGERYNLNRQPISAVPHHKYTLILGAGINSDGTPTPSNWVTRDLTRMTAVTA